ncbi:hypothetical protein FHW69_002327 [Luteibacter sp. Sphag1AF]|uniref:restriction endonuclease n=1 Tax=Luteibacter sp. Sphag1AF TaxID=2587031 RepID=UPI001607DAE1|nr:restriction endonuclease [Luteibacter sp. Sphag1AF]MBB3227704.1 hypothetical protein [Luteibacter sp. Sphag1AF]
MYGRKKVRQRHEDALSRVSWQDFEHLMANYFRSQGYVVEHTGTGASSTAFDGGIDLKLRRNDQYIVVQCKHWNAFQVPHNDVHQLIGVMQTQCASGAIFVVSGEYTKAALDAAAQCNTLRLIDGTEVRALLGDAVIMAAAARAPHHEPDWTIPSFAQPKTLRRRSRNDWLLHRMTLAVGFAMCVGFGMSMFLSSGAIHSRPPVPQNTTLPTQVAAIPQPVIAPPPHPTYTATQMTPAQLKEWEHKNAEAMQIMERTTKAL